MSKVFQEIDAFAVAPGVWGLKDIFVNMYTVMVEGSTDWVLVDAGLKTSAVKIKALAQRIFEDDNQKPVAIVLTHGHFDHTGSLEALAKEWDIPVWAHRLEAPYLAEGKKYPPSDATVGGGVMPLLSFSFPRTSADVADRLQLLPDDGSVPPMPGWRYIHTPGHSAGHISLFRDKDKVLLAGDAFVTTQQESLFSIINQDKTLCGPPKYFTFDWDAAEASVQALAALEPAIAATGHGRPFVDYELKKGLGDLTTNFKQVARPSRGRYAAEPAQADEAGITYLPPKTVLQKSLIASLALIAVAGLALAIVKRKKTKWDKFKDLMGQIADKRLS